MSFRWSYDIIRFSIMMLKIEVIIKKAGVRSDKNRRACMKRLMDMNEAKEVCKDRSRWRSIVSAYPHGKQA